MLGWVLFAVALVPMFWMGNRLVAREERAGIGPEGAGGQASSWSGNARSGAVDRSCLMRGYFTSSIFFVAENVSVDSR